MSIRHPLQWRMAGSIAALASPDDGAAALEALLADPPPRLRFAAIELLRTLSSQDWSARCVGRDGTERILRVDAGGEAWHLTLRLGAGATLRRLEPAHE